MVEKKSSSSEEWMHHRSLLQMAFDEVQAYWNRKPQRFLLIFSTFEMNVTFPCYCMTITQYVMDNSDSKILPIMSLANVSLHIKF